MPWIWALPMFTGRKDRFWDCTFRDVSTVCCEGGFSARGEPPGQARHGALSPLLREHGGSCYAVDNKYKPKISKNRQTGLTFGSGLIYENVGHGEAWCGKTAAKGQDAAQLQNFRNVGATRLTPRVEVPAELPACPPRLGEIERLFKGIMSQTGIYTRTRAVVLIPGRLFKNTRAQGSPKIKYNSEFLRRWPRVLCC